MQTWSEWEPIQPQNFSRQDFEKVKSQIRPDEDPDLFQRYQQAFASSTVSRVHVWRLQSDPVAATIHRSYYAYKASALLAYLYGRRAGHRVGAQEAINAMVQVLGESLKSPSYAQYMIRRQRYPEAQRSCLAIVEALDALAAAEPSGVIAAKGFVERLQSADRGIQR